jgi:glucokinase
MSAVPIFGTVKGGLGDCIVVSSVDGVITWRVEYRTKLLLTRGALVRGDLQGPLYAIQVLWTGDDVEIIASNVAAATASVPVIGEIFGLGESFLISVNQNGHVAVKLIGGEDSLVESYAFVPGVVSRRERRIRRRRRVRVVNG